MDFITFELAKKLKEKGFSQHWSDQYYILENEYEDDFFEVGAKYPVEVIYDYIPTIAAPTISQVLKWLRDERCFHVSPDLVSDYSVDADGNICEEWTYWSYSIHHIIDGVLYRDYNQFDHIEYQSYEEAALAGIEYVLDNLI